MEIPQISLIIPAYNSATTIQRCLNSVVSQSYFEDIEVIIVSDRSQDNTLEIINTYTTQYRNIIHIAREENCGLLEARRSGVTRARANYIMHLDSDDEFLCTNACELAYTTIKQTQADIVHFSSEVFFDSPQIKRTVGDKIKKTHLGYLYNENIFEKCFISETYNWNLWNKIFNAAVHKKTYSYIPLNCYSGIGEDYLTFFINAIIAKSFYGIAEPLILYHLGQGISTKNKISSLADINTMLAWFKINGILSDFLIAQGKHKTYEYILTRRDSKMLEKYLRKWPNDIADEIKPMAKKAFLAAAGELIFDKYVESLQPQKSYAGSNRNTYGPLGNLTQTGKAKDPSYIFHVQNDMSLQDFQFFLDTWVEPRIRTHLLFAYFQLQLIPWTSCEGHYDPEQNIIIDRPSLSFQYTPEVMNWLTPEIIKEINKLVAENHLTIFIRSNILDSNKESVTISSIPNQNTKIPAQEELNIAREQMFAILKLLQALKGNTYTNAYSRSI